MKIDWIEDQPFQYEFQIIGSPGYRGDAKLGVKKGRGYYSSGKKKEKVVNSNKIEKNQKLLNLEYISRLE